MQWNSGYIFITIALLWSLCISWGPRGIQTVLQLAASLRPCSTAWISTRVSRLLRKNRVLSELQHRSLYGHSWQTPTSALLVNILGVSALASFCLCASHPKALIRASGNQKTESMVTDREEQRDIFQHKLFLSLCSSVVFISIVFYSFYIWQGSVQQST